MALVGRGGRQRQHIATPRVLCCVGRAVPCQTGIRPHACPRCDAFLRFEIFHHLLNARVLVVAPLPISTPVGSRLARKFARGRSLQHAPRHALEDHLVKVFLVAVVAAVRLLHFAPIVLDALARELAMPLGGHNQDVAARLYHRLQRRLLVQKIIKFLSIIGRAMLANFMIYSIPRYWVQTMAAPGWFHQALQADVYQLLWEREPSFDVEHVGTDSNSKAYIYGSKTTRPPLPQARGGSINAWSGPPRLGKPC
eukprot:scaffold5221_cov122-Isochrysis_galbana.AAC.8